MTSMRSFVTIFLLTTWLHAKQPNIIVIFSDDQGYADLGCQGVDKVPVTPNIDALASRGIRFTSGFVTAPHRTPAAINSFTTLPIRLVFPAPRKPPTSKSLGSTGDSFFDKFSLIGEISLAIPFLGKLKVKLN